MAATDNPTILSECRTALQNVMKEVTGITAVNTVTDRYLNIALHDIHQERWWWAEAFGRLELHADYTTGTVSIALATRTTVTGSSTLWNTAVTGMGFNNARAGGKMTFAGAADVYPVASVASDTSLTLGEPCITAAALTAVSYSYYEDEYALPADFDDEHGVMDAINFPEHREIRVLPSHEFYRWYPRNSTAGTPRHATIIHLGPSGSVARRPRVVFAPPPTDLMTIPFRYYTTSLARSSAGVGQENMTANADEPIVPLRWRYGLILKAAEHWARDRKNDARAGEYKGQYETLMLRARASSDAADNRPKIEPRVGGYWPGGNRRGRRPRYVTGTEFEDLRR